METAVSTYDIEAVRNIINASSTTTTTTNAAGSATDDNDAKEVVIALFEKVSRTRAMDMVKNNVALEEIEKLFLFVVEVAKQGLCAKTLTVSLIQDLLDCSKKSKCYDIFTIVENHINVWKTKEFAECRNYVLRMCNDMLKRLSRTIDTQFCGRINILLARFLPLHERSGLNPTGQFNTFNETVYDMEIDDSELKAANDKQSGNEAAVEIDAVPEIPVDFKLYQEFWELQKFFSDPNKIYHKGEYETLQKYLNNVLQIFTTYRLDKRRTANNQHGNAMEVEEEIKRPDIFFAKYQTSQKLLHLQFADPQFRRYFLVQCLILVNYLQSEVKFREDTYFLTDDQQKYVNEISDKCYKLLRDTFPRGYYFSEFVKKLLSREKIWSLWKNEGCPDWLGSRPEQEVKSYQRKALPSYDPNKIDLGNEVLNRLWSLSSDNLSACKDSKRNFVPKLDDIINDALDHADPEQGVEEEYSCFNNEIWQWKQSRLFLTEGDNFLSIQSTPAARKPCPEFSEILKKGVYSIAKNHANETIRTRGNEVSKKAEEYQEKKEEEAKKAEAEERQRKEEEAKRKALEAAAERKKKDEELAAQREKERASVAARKPIKKEEEAPPAAAAPAAKETSSKETTPNARDSRKDSKTRRERSPSRREKERERDKERERRHERSERSRDRDRKEEPRKHSVFDSRKRGTSAENESKPPKKIKQEESNGEHHAKDKDSVDTNGSDENKKGKKTNTDKKKPNSSSKTDVHRKLDNGLKKESSKINH